MAVLPPFLPVEEVSIAAVGRPVSGNPFLRQTESAISSDVARAQITTINVTAATAGAHSVRVVAPETQNWPAIDRTVSFTPDGSPTQDELRDGLIAAMLADPILGIAVYPTAGTNTIALTGTQSGAGYTFTVTFPANPSTDLTQTATQAAADCATYVIGRFVEVTGRSGASLAVGEVNTVTPASISYAVTHGASATYTGTLTVQDAANREYPISWSASAGANLAATLTAINAAITGAVAAITGAVVDSATSPNVVLTFPAGWNGLVSLTATASGGGGSPAIAVTVTQSSTLPRYVLVTDPGDVAPVRGLASNLIYPVDGRPRPVPVVSGGGTAWGAEIASGASITANAQVYVETAAGASLGRATPTPSTTAAPVYLPSGQAVRWAQADTVSAAAAALTI